MPNALAASSTEVVQGPFLHEVGSKLKDPLFARWIFDRGSDGSKIPDVSIDSLFWDIAMAWSGCEKTGTDEKKAA